MWATPTEVGRRILVFFQPNPLDGALQLMSCPQLNQRTKFASQVVADMNAEDVVRLKDRYGHLTAILNELDDTMSPSLFVWYVTVLVALCSRFSAIVTRTSYETNLIFWWVTHLLGLLWTLAILFGVSLAAAAINEEPVRILSAVEASVFRTFAKCATKRNLSTSK